MHLIKNIKHPFCKLKVVESFNVAKYCWQKPPGAKVKTKYEEEKYSLTCETSYTPELAFVFFQPFQNNQTFPMIGLRNVIGSTGLKNPCMIDSFRLDLGSARNILWKKATQIVIFTSFRCLSSSLLKLLRRRARKRFSTMKFPTWVRQRSVVKVRVEFKK